MRRAKTRRYFEWGYFIMCCCNRQNRCCRCCCGSGTGNSGGAVTLPAFDSLSRMINSGSSNTTNTRWPVYVSVPAFLWEEDEDSNSCGSCGCGCCRG
ncbi:hypothetical protein [Pseudoflavonifractor phocaeensis]|uniref:hypothetical protein n=1 Tax=Pseudoflavonifractor phocaeensis TaxID=1870988 RepID=UPI00195A3FAE|nr:hypothetical protein [Pseudoflavonifractor phocaeensis]MBM6884408.1 hypothetical protein [Pseudoflavonifractor phocaeensis]